MTQATSTPHQEPAPTEPLLQVRGLKVSFGSGDTRQHAVDGVTLDVRKGQTVALVGESGCGKSLTSLALLRLTPPGSQVSAEVLRLDGSDIAAMSPRSLEDLRGRRVAMIFQNPMSAMNPVLRIGHQIVEVLRRHRGLRGRPARERAVELLRLVEMPDAERRLDQYPHQLSGGMRQRAMIAVALAGEPEVLIADEPTTALDVTLQAQIMNLLQRLQDELGMALLLITHDLGVVAQAADEVNVMYAGKIVERADVRTLYRSPAHPYTEALLRTVRDLAATDIHDLEPIPGAPPAPGRTAEGCPFAPRCPRAFDRCLVEEPALRDVQGGHLAACHIAEDVVREGASR